MKLKASILERNRLDRRGDAMFEFVKSLADAGDEKAATFLNKLLGGGFDYPSCAFACAKARENR